MADDEDDEKNFKFIQFNFEDHDKKLENALNYLKSLSAKQCIEDSLAYQAIFYMCKTVQVTHFDIYCQKNIEHILANILIELYSISSEFDFDNFEIDTQNQVKPLIKNNHRISLFSFVLHLVNNALFNSVKFTINFSNQRGLEAHFLFLKDENFLKRASNKRFFTFSASYIKIIVQIVLNIYPLSKNCDENIKKWLDLDAVNVLLRVEKLEPETHLESFLTISNIANDKQIESLTEIHKVTEALEEGIHRFAEIFKKDLFNRLHRQITQNDLVLNVSVSSIEEKNGTYSSILVYLSGLYRLMVNDKLRTDVYFRNTIKNDLKTILFKSNAIEMNYLLKLYAQLSFNPVISVDLSNEKDFVDFLTQIYKSSDHANEKAKDLCRKILWNLETNVKERDASRKHGEHIMISYNSANRELCLRIKSELELYGLKVWIDVNNIHGSSLDSMAMAVENSICVLICITEKYRQSVNCQSEAQYAFKLKKPIIPLIMQKDYENVKGWLGIILSDKIFINFTKYVFDECMNRLKREISSIYSVNVYQTVAIKNVYLSLKKEPESVKNWSEVQVKEWLDSNQTNQFIVEQIFPCDGNILIQLYEMRRDAPEFYYQALNKNNTVDLKSIMLFTQYLKSFLK